MVAGDNTCKGGRTEHQQGRKIKLVETLNEEEKKMVFSFVDTLVGKKKLKDALLGVLNDVK